AAGGALARAPDDGAGQRPDRLAGDAGSGSGRAGVPSGPAGRRLAVSVSGWGEPAGAAAQWAQTGAAPRGLWDPGRWHAPVAGLHAEPGGESGGVGGPAARSVSAGIAWRAPPPARDRGVCVL